MSSPLSPTKISKTTFRAVLELYPSLVKKVYATKLKGNAKKVAEAMENEHFRFEGLGAMLEGRERKDSEKKGSLTKGQVERLVQWKITHGHSRPFLPAMVRKNDASAVQTQTSLAFSELISTSPSPPSLTTVTTALDMVCKLNGIGPATGTLILNVFNPTCVPFFQDEMYAWVFPDSKGEKLKYSMKEYKALFQEVAPILKRLGCTAVELEKVAYVLGHMEVLKATDRAELETLFEKDEMGGGGDGREEDGKDPRFIPGTDILIDGAEALARLEDEMGDLKELPPVKKVRKRGFKDEEPTEGVPAPKRRSQRSK